MSVFDLRVQDVEWTLLNLPILLSGEWPDSVDIEPIKKGKQGIKHAPFENPILLATEVSQRLELIDGLDGDLVREKYLKGLSEEEIAERRYIREERVYQGIHRALVFMSGVNRKPQTYRQWRFEKKKT